MLKSAVNRQDILLLSEPVDWQIQCYGEKTTGFITFMYCIAKYSTCLYIFSYFPSIGVRVTEPKKPTNTKLNKT